MKHLIGMLFLVALAAHGHDFTAGDVRIVHPFAVPTVPGATTGAAYVLLENRGKRIDRLVAASSPRAKRVELHHMTTSDGVMRMREVDAIEVKPGESVKMRPGAGFHLMLTDLSAPLRQGETFPIFLTFEKGGKVEVKAYVQVPKASAGEHKH